MNEILNLPLRYSSRDLSLAAPFCILLVHDHPPNLGQLLHTEIIKMSFYCVANYIDIASKSINLFLDTFNLTCVIMYMIVVARSKIYGFSWLSPKSITPNTSQSSPVLSSSSRSLSLCCKHSSISEIMFTLTHINRFHRICFYFYRWILTFSFSRTRIFCSLKSPWIIPQILKNIYCLLGKYLYR